MNTVGFELCDAGFQAAQCVDQGPQVIELDGMTTGLGWPAIVQQRAAGLVFGREAESEWYVHPRSVSNLFWEKLSREPSNLAAAGRTPSFSELGFFFLQDYIRRIASKTGQIEKAVLAIPGGFLRDANVEDEKVGLLLGMAGELGLPLARIVDVACAAFGGPAAREFPRGAPLIHVDVHLHAAEISLLRSEDRVVRQHYHHVPQVGYIPILRHLKNAMGNRFLRQTAFDIHEDRRLEQAFYEQTKAFLISGGSHANEFQYQINTGRRSYQMVATHAQLAADLQAFDHALVQGVMSTAQFAHEPPDRCVVALSDRAGRLDGLEASLRAAGFVRIFRLRPGAGAMGAAALAEQWPVVNDLAEVPVETEVPFQGSGFGGAPVESALLKPEFTEARPTPSHVIVEGIGYAIGDGGLTLGTRHTRTAVDVALPKSFDIVGDYVVSLVRDDQQIWLELPAHEAPGSSANEKRNRATVAAGDRLTLRGAGRTAEVLFIYCCGETSGNGQNPLEHT